MPADPPSSPALRASDADRDRVTELLGAAVADGPLGPAEFDERLDAALAARTIHERHGSVPAAPTSGASPATSRQEDAPGPPSPAGSAPSPGSTGTPSRKSCCTGPRRRPPPGWRRAA
jgi:hypothetical protein